MPGIQTPEEFAAEFKNAIEEYPYYDTVCIGLDVEDGLGWFTSYAAMGAKKEIAFYNARNSSEVGEAYNNQDSSSNMPYAYKAYSFGLEMSAPSVMPQNAGAPPTANMIAQALFAFELIKHASIDIRLQQDSKLVAYGGLVPPGTGTMGGMNALVGSNFLSGITTSENGWPVLKNRWTFQKPLGFPRGCVIKVLLTFSEYARDMLSKMLGPGNMTLDTGVTHAQRAMIRMSFMGKRAVQQRNELHVG